MDKRNNFTARNKVRVAGNHGLKERDWTNWNYYLGVEYKYSTLDKLDHSLFLAPSPEPDPVGRSGSAPGAGGDDTFSSNPNPFQTPSSVAKRTKQVWLFYCIFIPFYCISIYCIFIPSPTFLSYSFSFAPSPFSSCSLSFRPFFLSTRFLLKTSFSVISLKIVGGFLDFYELGKYGELCRKRMKRRGQFVSCSFFQCSPNLKKLILENLKVLNFYAYERMIKSLLVFLQSVLRYPFVFVLICTEKNGSGSRSWTFLWDFYAKTWWTLQRYGNFW